jgi:crotonobetaine/carnitine-CoA ligase
MDPALESLGHLLERQTEALGGQDFISFGDGTTLTYASFSERVSRARGLLASSGIGPGDRVALMMKNSLFYPTAWLGVLTLGAVAVPVNSRLGPDDAAHIVGHSGARLVVCDTSTAPVARKVAGDAVVEVGTQEHAPEALTAAEPAPAASCTGRTLANVQYTSGTTGFPKGCLLTHGFWQRMGHVAVGLLRLGPGKRILTAQPFSYIDPLWQVVATLRSGAHMVVLDGFHPSTMMREVAEWKISTFYCLGAMPTLLLKQPPAPWDRDHALERVSCSAIPPALHAEIEERFGVPWLEAFGMTETGINIAVSDEEHDELVGSGSIGRSLGHCEASVVDSEGRDVPPGNVGELRLRGLGFMEGYLDDPEATARFFWDGWAHTGDLVEMDLRGRIYFRGRIKEMVRRGGENISQAEVELALRGHPEVLDCAVAGVPDEIMGEEAKAYLVPVPGRHPDPKALHAFLGARLAAFKVPRYYEFRDDLPRTPSERVAKPRLEDRRASWRDGTYDARAGRWL